MQACPSCAAETPDRFRLCGFCGATLRPELHREIRRHATILFSDLKGSTSLGEALDSEALFEVLSRYFDAMRDELELHGGKIEKLIGDAIVAVFGLPVPHADDAMRAVRAASACQAALARLNGDLERAYGIRLTNRTGIASGEVSVGVPGPGEHVLTGAVVQQAMVLEAAAPPMGVLLGESTFRAVQASVLVEPVPFPGQPHGGVHGGGGDRPGDAGEGECAYEVVSLVDGDSLAAERSAASTKEPEEDVIYCPNCGEEDPTTFLVCGTCGTSLEGDGAGEESRKTVTIVFCDLHATDPDGTPLEAQALHAAISQGFAIARGQVEHHGGSAEKFIGDAMVAVFGLPVLHEDDGLRAVRAALGILEALAARDRDLAAAGIRLRARIGVNTGLVVAGNATQGLHLVTGDAVNTAARLEQNAPEQGILLGASTYALVRDAVHVESVAPLALKGKTGLVEAHRLVAIHGLEGRSRRYDAPLVGRAAEMARLRRVFTAAVGRNTPRLITVVGDAGLGKSRLVREFEHSLGDGALVLRGRCLAYGEGITFWPVAEIVRSAAAVHDDDSSQEAHRKVAEVVGDREVADRLTAIAGLSDTPYPLAELFWGVRRFLESLAGRRPLVVVVDGVQWVEPAMVDLLEHLVTTMSGAPVTIVCLGRSELLEARPDWAGWPHASRLLLGPLAIRAGARIVDRLLGGGHAVRLRDRIVTASQGNPLFMEQMVSMLMDNGTLRFEDGRWVPADEAAEIALPPSIQALLAARVDQLPRGERLVIQPAAVVGYEFGQRAVEALVSEASRPVVDTGLASLVVRQFVRPDPAAQPGDEAFRFRNLLIRDAAYDSLLKRARVALHEGYVRWMDGFAAEHGRAREFEEILGYHLEQAYRYRTEFGPPDAEATAVGRDGALRLASAGRRSSIRGDMNSAASLLRRAGALLRERDPQRLGLLPELAEALMELGDFESADGVLREATDLATAVEDERLRANASLIQALLRFYQGGDGDGWSGKATATAELAISTFGRLDDAVGMTRAWRILFGVNATACRYGAATEAAERVLEYARLAGDPRQESRGAGAYAQAALLGPTPIPEAIARCAEILRRVDGDRKIEAIVLLAMAELEGMRGDFDVARGHYRRAHAMLSDLGRSYTASSTSINSWRVEFLAGDLATAERLLRRDYDALDAMGERFLLSSLSAFLGRVLLAKGRLDEAAQLAARARGLADADDIEAQALWRGLEAQVQCRLGAGAAAVELAWEALRLLEPTDAPVLRADSLTALADVLESSGTMESSQDRIASVRAEALRLYQAKGCLVAADRLGGREAAVADPATAFGSA